MAFGGGCDRVGVVRSGPLGNGGGASSSSACADGVVLGLGMTAVECGAQSFWRARLDTAIVLFRGALGHDTHNGVCVCVCV